MHSGLRFRGKKAARRWGRHIMQGVFVTINPSVTEQFTPGVSIDTPPIGVAERQAVASLRGYAYQVAAATLAWLDLDSSGKVYLEVTTPLRRQI
jgi:hypothetical protein